MAGRQRRASSAWQAVSLSASLLAVFVTEPAKAQPALDGPGARPLLKAGEVVLDGPEGPRAAAWNLDGAGRASLANDDPQLQALGAALAGRGLNVDLGVAPDGAFGDCRIPAGQQNAGMGAQLCAALVRRGTFARNAKLELPADARLSIFVSATRQWAPALPVRFVADPAGWTSVSITEQADGSCRAEALTIVPGYDAPICDAWRAAGRPGLTQSGAVRYGSVSIALDAAGTARYDFQLGSWGIAQKGEVRSGLGDPAPGLRLGTEDGRISLALESDDYPVRALREEMEGRVVVWIGFDGTGVGRSCRPIQSSNSAFLANASCTVFLRRARYAFAEGRAAFAGLRYARAAVVWKLP